MAVYTALTESDLEDFLTRYAVGSLVSFEGIRDGVENSNFFLTTDVDTYVLTIFEKHPAAEVPYYLNLTAHLAEHGVPCAHPVADADGTYLQSLHGKPAALIECLPGTTLEDPGPGHCAAVGRALGHMHVAARTFDEYRENGRGPAWWFRTARELADVLDAENRRILEQECAYQKSFRGIELPRGTIHADLFRDNVLFDDDRLAGMIDFYYACHDCLLYDVAIAVNDWCGVTGGHLDPERVRALLDAYHAERPFVDAEARTWNMMLRAGALRFWLSRLLDLHFPRPAEVPHVKNPDEYRRILLARREDEPVLGPLAAVS
ncbi:MAG: homoserine kinase [Halofilum sp. (in: g-proteobacteria)]|nr:homoserine kinase [Halofilum sp. (in: g-proteobacteria)]